MLNVLLRLAPKLIKPMLLRNKGNMASLKYAMLLVVVLVCLVFDKMSYNTDAKQLRFSIDFSDNCFIKDGFPFRYVSGSFHYFRTPSVYWDDVFKKMRAGGLNTVQTYVPWNYHELYPNVFDFEGDRDIGRFLELAHQNNLLAILRPGPFIDAEWEFGGLPSWLLKERDIVLRSSNEKYLRHVDRWMNVLLTRLKPYLYENGGPIIMVQVENEYGSYGCDHGYLEHLYHLFLDLLGENVVLFTTNGCSHAEMECGSIPQVYSTVDFGTEESTKECLNLMREFEPHGPLVNSEFYTGWEDFWGKNKSRVDSKILADYLDELLSMGNISVNMYMFEGGTNFRFMNGADVSRKGLYLPEITSYDYDAPLTEAGDTWKKFDLIKQVLSKHVPLPPVPLPPNAPKTAYGKVRMTEYCWLFDAPVFITRSMEATDPVVMEDLDQSYGYVLYQLQKPLSILPQLNTSFNLTLQGVHDRAYVFVDREIQGVLQRVDTTHETMSIAITAGPSSEGVLRILVENQGRICYVPPTSGSESAGSNSLLNDRKGILNGVLLNGEKLEGWTSHSIPMNSSIPEEIFKSLPSSGTLPTSAVLFKGTIPPVPSGVSANDTYLLLSGWTKGIVFINDFNIGRYWPVRPPQKTLYVPSSLLKSDGTPNTVVVFEQDSSPCHPPDYSDCVVTFVDKPVFD